jgi:hypothetical protein
MVFSIINDEGEVWRNAEFVIESYIEQSGNLQVWLDWG